MNYCGIDLGKKSSHFHIVDGDRKTMTAGKLSNNVEAIRKVFANRERLKIVIEASCKAFWMAPTPGRCSARPDLSPTSRGRT